MPDTSHDLFQFGYILYPLWRRQLPVWIKSLADPLLRNIYPVAIDEHPPQSLEEMAAYLVKWGIFQIVDQGTLARSLHDADVQFTVADTSRQSELYQGGKVRIPAQWEPMQKVLISWGILYPPLWQMQTQMVETISKVADVEILVPSELWARAVWTFLSWREFARMENVRFTCLKTNDVWVRDYGPILAIDEKKSLVALNHIYDPLPNYPQADDDAMPERWSAHHEIPILNYDLHTEGGNLWTDGQGTLIMSERIFFANPYYDRDSLETYLHSFLDFEKLIITPRVAIEETGHVDLLTKLATEDTVLVSKASSLSTKMPLVKNRRLFMRERNAKGKQYNVVELPTPPLYFNWLVYPIRRSYTNTLTINNTVLVPTFGAPEDDTALAIYEQTFPDYQVIPIDCSVAINGGGAVHCMTKEVPLIE